MNLHFVLSLSILWPCLSAVIIHTLAFLCFVYDVCGSLGSAFAGKAQG